MIKYIDKEQVLTFSFENSSKIKQIKYIVEYYYDFNASDLIESLVRENSDAKNNLISKDKFLEWANLTTSYDNKVVTALLSLFKAFTAPDQPLVDNIEIACGILCYLNGSKSQKLSIAFKLFEDNSDGTISRRKLWRLLRSFMKGLSLLCKFSLKLQIDEVCVLIVGKIFKYFEDPAFITLEDLSNWYLFCGNEISFWLELLDVNKWIYDY